MSPEKTFHFHICADILITSGFYNISFSFLHLSFLDVYCQENLFVWENGLQNHVKAVWWRIQGGLFYFFNNMYVYVVCSRGHETM